MGIPEGVLEIPEWGPGVKETPPVALRIPGGGDGDTGGGIRSSRDPTGISKDTGGGAGDAGVGPRSSRDPTGISVNTGGGASSGAPPACGDVNSPRLFIYPDESGIPLWDVVDNARLGFVYDFIRRSAHLVRY